jgi:hypothetical protein
MTLQAPKAFISRRPFEPLRVKTSNGEVFEIRHPERVMLARSAMVILHANGDDSPSDKVEYVSYLHVASIETLAGQAA